MGKKPTAKQEAFCVAYVGCMDATKAYRQVYDVSPDTKPSVVRNLAYKVMCKPVVEARITELRGQAARVGLVTLETHLADLARLRDMAEQDGQFSAAISAEISRGKAVGLYTERLKQEVTGANGGPVSSEILVRFVEAEHGNG
jgi:hypothetical protein